MRYLFGFVCVLAGLVASPLSASAQAGEEAATSAAVAVHAKYHLPPQLMLRVSYYLYLDADADTGPTSDQTEPNAEEPKSAQAGEEDSSRLERWHPEAFVDPSKPSSEPAPEEPDIDTLSQKAIEHYEIQSAQSGRQGGTEGRSRGAKAGIAVGVILGVGLVGVAIGAGVAMSNWEM